eukprot:jgi/Ulvmu1/10077/UM006_0024.1
MVKEIHQINAERLTGDALTTDAAVPTKMAKAEHHVERSSAAGITRSKHSLFDPEGTATQSNHRLPEPEGTAAQSKHSLPEPEGAAPDTQEAIEKPAPAASSRSKGLKLKDILSRLSQPAQQVDSSNGQQSASAQARITGALTAASLIPPATGEPSLYTGAEASALANPSTAAPRAEKAQKKGQGKPNGGEAGASRGAGADEAEPLAAGKAGKARAAKKKAKAKVRVQLLSDEEEESDEEDYVAPAPTDKLSHRAVASSPPEPRATGSQASPKKRATAAKPATKAKLPGPAPEADLVAPAMPSPAKPPAPSPAKPPAPSPAKPPAPSSAKPSAPTSAKPAALASAKPPTLASPARRHRPLTLGADAGSVLPDVQPSTPKQSVPAAPTPSATNPGRSPTHKPTPCASPRRPAAGASPSRKPAPTASPLRKTTRLSAKQAEVAEYAEPDACELPAPVEELRVADAPAAEAPAADAPAAEAPAADAPAAEAPAADAPAAEAPAADAPAAEAPAADAPAAEAPAADAPSAEAPATEATVAEAPVADVSAPEAPVAEAPAAEVPVAEALVAGVSAAEAPVAQAPAVEASVPTPTPVKRSARVRAARAAAAQEAAARPHPSEPAATPVRKVARLARLSTPAATSGAPSAAAARALASVDLPTSPAVGVRLGRRVAIAQLSEKEVSRNADLVEVILVNLLQCKQEPEPAPLDRSESPPALLVCQALHDVLRVVSWDSVTTKNIRERVVEHLGYSPTEFMAFKPSITATIRAELSRLCKFKHHLIHILALKCVADLSSCYRRSVIFSEAVALSAAFPLITADMPRLTVLGDAPAALSATLQALVRDPSGAAAEAFGAAGFGPAAGAVADAVTPAPASARSGLPIDLRTQPAAAVDEPPAAHAAAEEQAGPEMDPDSQPLSMAGTVVPETQSMDVGGTQGGTEPPQLLLGAAAPLAASATRAATAAAAVAEPAVPPARADEPGAAGPWVARKTRRRTAARAPSRQREPEARPPAVERAGAHAAHASSAPKLHFPHDHPVISIWAQIGLLTGRVGCFQRRATQRLQSLRSAACFVAEEPLFEMAAWYKPLPKIEEESPAAAEQSEASRRQRQQQLLLEVTRQVRSLAPTRRSPTATSQANTTDAAEALALLGNAGEEDSGAMSPAWPTSPTLAMPPTATPDRAGPIASPARVSRQKSLRQSPSLRPQHAAVPPAESSPADHPTPAAGAPGSAAADTDGGARAETPAEEQAESAGAPAVAAASPTRPGSTLSLHALQQQCRQSAPDAEPATDGEPLARRGRGRSRGRGRGRGGRGSVALKAGRVRTRRSTGVAVSRSMTPVGDNGAAGNREAPRETPESQPALAAGIPHAEAASTPSMPARTPAAPADDQRAAARPETNGAGPSPAVQATSHSDPLATAAAASEPAAKRARRAPAAPAPQGSGRPDPAARHASGHDSGSDDPHTSPCLPHGDGVAGAARAASHATAALDRAAAARPTAHREMQLMPLDRNSPVPTPTAELRFPTSTSPSNTPTPSARGTCRALRSFVSLLAMACQASDRQPAGPAPASVRFAQAAQSPYMLPSGAVGPLPFQSATATYLRTCIKSLHGASAAPAQPLFPTTPDAVRCGRAGSAQHAEHSTAGAAAASPLTGPVSPPAPSWAVAMHVILFLEPLVCMLEDSAAAAAATLDSAIEAIAGTVSGALAGVSSGAVAAPAMLAATAGSARATLALRAPAPLDPSSPDSARGAGTLCAVLGAVAAAARLPGASAVLRMWLRDVIRAASASRLPLHATPAGTPVAPHAAVAPCSHRDLPMPIHASVAVEVIASIANLLESDAMPTMKFAAMIASNGAVASRN